MERRRGRGARCTNNAARCRLRIGVVTPKEFSLAHIIAIGLLTVHGLLAGGRARPRRRIVVVVRIAAEQLVLQVLVHRRHGANRTSTSPSTRRSEPTSARGCLIVVSRVPVYHVLNPSLCLRSVY